MIKISIYLLASSFLASSFLASSFLASVEKKPNISSSKVVYAYYNAFP